MDEVEVVVGVRPEVVEISEEVRVLDAEGIRNPETEDRSSHADFPPTPPRGRDPAIQARENIIFLADQEVRQLWTSGRDFGR